MLFAGHLSFRRMEVTSAARTLGRPREAGALLRTCLLLLGMLPAHAVDRPSLVRAGSGMRQDDIQMQHLTRKAVCSRNFLGQTPLFKGEWVPHQVSCPCTPFCSSHSPELPAMTSSIFPELQLYE